MRALFSLGMATMFLVLMLSLVARAQPTENSKVPFPQRFAAANTTHDGCLTQDQATAGHMNGVVKVFTQIDTAKKGCITLGQIQAYRQQNRPRQ
jgi:hypothetical protein